MAELLMEYRERVRGPDGRDYCARAWGEATGNGRWWTGWLEFTPVRGGPTLRTQRETTQPNHMDAEYWATGLEAVYLRGALERAMERVSREATPAMEIRKVESRRTPDEREADAY